MKIFNKLASALTVLPMLAALMACSDESTYTPAEKLTGEQVYFANDLPSQLAINKEDGKVVVKLNRVKTDDALTVNLVSEQPEGQTLFTVPADVTFAEGEKEAVINITFDPNAVEYDVNYSCTLSIGNEEYTTPYGFASYSFVGCASSPVTPWVSDANSFADAGGIGEWQFGTAPTATFSYAQFAEGDQTGVKVSVRQNTVEPGNIQIRLANYGQGILTENGVEVILDGKWDEDEKVYRITWPETFTGYTHSSYGPVNVSDLCEYTGWEWSKAPSQYDPATGRFDLYLVYYVSAGAFGYGLESMQMDGFYVPDYSAAVTYGGILKTPDDASQAVIDFTIGKDASAAKYALTDAAQSAEDVAVAIAKGELEGTDAENGRNYITLSEEGKFRVTLVTFDENGEAADFASCVFEFEKGGSSWESLGMCVYTDDFMTYGYYDEENEYAWVTYYDGITPQTYNVEVFANTKKPGIYRLKNAYGAAYPYNEEGDWDASQDYFLEINAEDPTAVYIEKQALGLDWGKGMFSVESDGAYYMAKYGLTPAQIIAALAAQGYDSPFGTLADGVITFPADAFTVSFGDNEFYGNHNGGFKLVLPTAPASVKAAAKARASKKVVRKPNRSNIKKAGQKTQKTLCILKSKNSIKSLKF